MPALMVANAGGHVAELVALSEAFDPAGTARWVTNDTTQTRSLLAERSVVWADYSTPRDLRALVRHLRLALRSLQGVDHVVSTGSSLAPAFLLAARLRGIRGTFVESATRLDGPSLSGRLVSAIPGVDLFTQTPDWTSARWRFGGCVWDGWEPCDREVPAAGRVRVLVTTGTARDFGFGAMVSACLAVVQPEWDVVWQVGRDASPELPGRVVGEVPYDEMVELTRSADLVFAHAGAGSTLLALDSGVRPVLFARTAARGEHVDDHQAQLAAAVAERDLAEVADPTDGISPEVLERVFRRGVRVRAAADASWRFEKST